MNKINLNILKIIVCPLTKSPLIYDSKKEELISKKAKLAFPIYEGIPILLINEARSLKS